MPSVSFATLLNTRILVPSPLKTHYNVDKYFLAECLRGYIEHIYFDENWYLARYPDVANVVAADATLSARDHFVRFGYFENRMPYPIKIDETWYRANYQDVERAILERRYPSAQAHFDRVGYSEGRLPYPGFELRMMDE